MDSICFAESPNMIPKLMLALAPKLWSVSSFSSNALPPKCCSVSSFISNPIPKFSNYPTFCTMPCSQNTTTTATKVDGAPDVLEFLDSLKNYEKLGVPKGAGTDSDDGFDLGRMRRLLSRLGDPLSKYPVVHIAGTKGKGSTAAFISNILRAQGYSVGCYTSPHVMSIHERIIAGYTEEPVSPTSFQSLFQDNWKVIDAAVQDEKGSLTYFEVLTALAFKYFAQQRVDVAVVEAGLGGARDATNVISSAGLAIAVITNIGKEHLAALGGSLETVAVAKSGIIKENRPVVLGGPMDPHIREVISNVASSRKSRIIPAFGEGINYTLGDIEREDDDIYQCCNISISEKIDKSSLKLRMLGRHQVSNVLTAISTMLCLRDQGWKIDDNSIWSGIERTRVLGRFQIIPKAKASKLVGQHTTLILDGAHTAGSAEALASTLRMVFPSVPCAFVVTMASDKDHPTFCSELISGATPKIIVATQSSVAGSQVRSTSASVLAEACQNAAKKHNLEVVQILDQETGPEFYQFEQNERSIIVATAETVLDSINKASLILAANYGGGLICITGSLHALSSVLSQL